MKKYTKEQLEGKKIYVGIDVHLRTWHVTARTDEVELFCGSIPGNWESLLPVLERFYGSEIQAVYEASRFGFWLHDILQEVGINCIVTPPSLLPQEVGNRVKTDKRDSRKLARLLSKGLLKRIYVPTKEERHHRQVIRRRRQLIGDRIRVQCRIKAELSFYGFDLSMSKGKWSKKYLENLKRVRFGNRWMDESFKRLLEEYEFLNEQISKQTELIRSLSETEEYKDRVSILRSIPGVGLIVAMELLLELQDVGRFKRAEELAAYIGLTPSQYSSGDKVRLGRITRTGKSGLRGSLIEASWQLIGKDAAMQEKYERIKLRAGGKRAIVAVARTLLIRARRMLLDGTPYAFGIVG